MRIIYIALVDLKDNNCGVSKKINSQIKSLSDNKKNKISKLYRDSEGDIVINSNSLGKYSRELFFKVAKQESQGSDLIYLRYPKSDWLLLSFLSHVKKQNKKVIIEIPTYPYDGEGTEIKTLQNKLKKQIDVFFRKKLKKHCDFIVTFSEDNMIFGIPTIKISNGVDSEEIENLNINKIDDKIHFTSVSGVAIAHGIDRFLNSMKAQEKELSGKIQFNIIGEGVETKKLKEIVEGNVFLQESTVFHGKKSGQDLKKIYEQTNIAVGSLGRHRNEISVMKSIKNREYAAKGLPMIYSEIDLDFENKDFVYKVSANEENLDILEIIKWYKSLKVSPQEICNYAKQFTWDIQMKKILKTIDNSGGHNE